MFSQIVSVLFFLSFSSCYCRSTVEETVIVDEVEEDKADLQVERYENGLYNVILTVSNETFDFNITKKDFDVDVWIADDEGNTTKADYQEVELYENRDLISSVVIFKDDHSEEFHVNGLISENLGLKSSRSSRSKREIEAKTAKLCPNCLNLAEHYVIRSADHFEKDADEADADEADFEHIIEDINIERQSRRLPDVIHPQMLVYVDYDLYKKMGKHVHSTKRYIVSYINAVNLRFETLAEPKIEMSIAGIIVGRSRSSFPFVNSNMIRRTYLDAPASLHSMGEYFYVSRTNLPQYDMVIAMTGLNMARRMNGGSNWNYNTAGYSYIGGACVKNKRLKKISSVALVEDSGAYSGVIVTAHEVGHLLGAVHDGDVAPRYLGGPGAQKCPWNDGYIMSDKRRTSRGLHWSECSLKSMKHYLKSSRSSCLRNKPRKEDYRLRGSKILSADSLSLDAQCQADKGTKACYHDHRVCAQLFCAVPHSTRCYAYRPAVEGSRCGGGKICRSGKCIRN